MDRKYFEKNLKVSRIRMRINGALICVSTAVMMYFGFQGNYKGVVVQLFPIGACVIGIAADKLISKQSRAVLTWMDQQDRLDDLNPHRR